MARLHDLYTDPAVRRLGGGRAVRVAAVNWCAGRAVRYLEWQASPAAIGFYTRLGYSPDFNGDFRVHPFFEHTFDNTIS